MILPRPSPAHRAARALALAGALLLAAVLAATGPLLVMRYVAPAGPGFQAATGEPPAGDFLVFYAAGRLAAEGGDPYDLRRLAATAKAHTTAPLVNTAPFAYPPPTLWPLAALARAPPTMALWLWLAASVAATGLAGWIATRRLGGAVATLGFPGLGVVLACGQTSAFAPPLAAVIAQDGARRPLLAGAALGLLALKPQLAMGVGVLLALDGRWRTLAAAGAMAAGLALASLAAGGVEPWRAFFDAVAAQAERTADRHLPLSRMVTPFAALRLSGAPTGLALAGHAGVAVVAFAALLRLWRSGSPTARALAVALAPAFASPYLFDYDLAPLAGAFALTLAAAPHDRPGHRLAWLALLGAAMPTVLLASLHAKAPLGAAVVTALLWAATFGPIRFAPAPRTQTTDAGTPLPAARVAWPTGRTRAKEAR